MKTKVLVNQRYVTAEDLSIILASIVNHLVRDVLSDVIQVPDFYKDCTQNALEIRQLVYETIKQTIESKELEGE